ncbi:hypothetical protein GCM10023186_19690 [Hymenobacter koreensis]|uniref:Secretion system C-terminal sorting domain-containing protein n=2 Tax=Hymenobacter koreensis TaxID=1084523 RepID=A0ABP8IYS1_9BACT
MAQVLLVVVSLFSTPLSAWAQQVPNVTFQGPITITQGGTYSGNYRSNDTNVPAIRIATTQPVIIQNSIIASAGDLISGGSGADLTVRNTQGYGLTPTVDNRHRGRFIAMNDGRRLTAEYNYMEHTCGIVVYRWTGDGSANQTVTVRYNKAKNIDGRFRNQIGGTAQEYNGSFIGFNTVQGIANIVVAFNEVINTPNESATGDIINFWNSSGTATSPARVHDNFIKGAYPYPATMNSYSGTGITTDGDGSTPATTTAFLHAYNNQFVATSNASMNIAAGHDVYYHHNRMVTSALFPDGSPMRAVYAATSIFNAYQKPSTVFFNNRVEHNTIGFRNPGYTVPFPDRHDLSYGNCTPCTNTTHLPNPITLQTEANEFTLWQQKLQQNGITVGANGSGTAPTVPTNQAPTVSLTSPAASTVTIGQALALAATAADADGTVARVEFFNGATKLGEDTSAPYTLSYATVAAGTLSLTAKATDNAGASTSSAPVTVTVQTAVTPPPTSGSSTLYRAINVNGPAITLDGNTWEAGATAANVQISGTALVNPNVALVPSTDATRSGMIRSFIYDAPLRATIGSVPNGTYSVFLHVFEDNSPETFSIAIGGQTVLSNYNSGSAGTWRRLGPFAANVTDGNLRITTSGGHVNLSGLEIFRSSTTTAPTTPTTPTTTRSLYRAINVNGAATTIDGISYEAGTAPANVTVQGSRLTAPSVTLVPATDAARTEMIRSFVWSNRLNYTLTNVPAGTYEVSFYAWEDNNAETFSVSLNGQTVVSNHNSGSAGSWRKFGPFATTVSNGTISLLSSGGAMNLSGIEVFRTTAVTISSATVQAYPNPFVDQLNVMLTLAQAETVTLALYNGSGIEVQRSNVAASAGSSTATLNVTALPTGLYVLRILTGSLSGQTIQLRK